MKKLSHNRRICKYLQTHKRGLNPLQALSKFGCFRLASRICDLRQLGYIIDDERVTKNGKSYSRYFM